MTVLILGTLFILFRKRLIVLLLSFRFFNFSHLVPCKIIFYLLKKASQPKLKKKDFFHFFEKRLIILLLCVRIFFLILIILLLSVRIFFNKLKLLVLGTPFMLFEKKNNNFSHFFQAFTTFFTLSRVRPFFFFLIVRNFKQKKICFNKLTLLILLTLFIFWKLFLYCLRKE